MFWGGNTSQPYRLQVVLAVTRPGPDEPSYPCAIQGKTLAVRIRSYLGSPIGTFDSVDSPVNP